MKSVWIIVLFLLFWAAVFLDSVLRSANPKELKRRARSGDHAASRLYKAAAYLPSASPFLWLVGGLSLGGLVILTNKWVSWEIILLALALITLMWTAKAPKNYSGWVIKLLSYLAPALGWILAKLHPVVGRFARPKKARSHTGAYEKEDLLELIKVQHAQADNRISESDLKLALSVLQFGDKTVGQIMTPRKKVNWISEDEPIGPLLMDELHETGSNAFPVVKDIGKKSALPQVVGTLYLRDLLDQPAGGKAKDVMEAKVYFINESNNLREALAAFTKVHHHLLIVVNNFEEVVGVLPFEVLLHNILGEKPASDFELYHDKRAVAGKTQPKNEPAAEKA